MSNKNKNPLNRKNHPDKTPSNTSAHIKNNNILTRFFSHNITLMVLSFVLAFAIWFVISANSETDSSVTISNIPVSIELSEMAQEDGLEVFLSSELKASVEVSGNRVTVGSLSADDIAVYATQTGSIISSGTYTLPLNAKKTGIKNNYEIVSAVTPSSVTIRVDKRMDVELPIENRLSVQGVDSSHYANVTLTPSNIHLSGPESQVSRIAAAVVFDSINAESTVKQVKFLDSEGNELNFPLVNTDVDEVEVSVIVLPVEEIDLAVSLTGAPEQYPSIEINPSTVKVAGAQESLDMIEDHQLSIGTLDFTTLRNEKYTKSFALTAPSGCRIISVDNKSKEMKAEATIDLSGYSSTSLSCTVKPGGGTAGYNVNFVADTITVDICGPESVLQSLTSAKLSAVADFTDYLKDVTDSTLNVPAVPVKITFTGTEGKTCWVYGSYTAAASITRK